MKIAFLSFYNGIRERGVENWVNQLSRRLRKNHEVFIYQVQKGMKQEFIRHLDIEVDWNSKNIGGIIRRLYLDYYSRKINSFTRKALKEIDKHNVDLIIPTNGGWQTLLCRIFTSLRKKKMIVVGHSGIGWDDFVNMMIRPDVFVALTDFQKNWVKKLSLGTRIEKISDGVDIDHFTPEGEKLNLALPRPIILVVSALSPGKRVDLAIQAVSKLEKGSLIVLGDGTIEEVKKIKEKGNKLLGPRFLFNKVRHDEMVFWYRSCDIFTFPAWGREAFGLVLLEAMACNKPVVCTKDPIKKEIVGEAGFYCNPSDILEYAQSLAKTINYNFKNIPREQAKKFSWDNISSQYEELFKTL